MHCTFQVSRMLQRLPVEQRPLATQEGRARHSRAQHEAAGEEDQEAEASGHRFSAIEWASVGSMSKSNLYLHDFLLALCRLLVHLVNVLIINVICTF